MAVTELAAHTDPTALVVEDDEVIAHVLQLVLQREGFAVARASTGRSAQAYIAESAPPDLVTLDGTLPDVSGFAVLERMRSTPAWRDVPVLLITGYSVHERDVSRALKAGKVAYIAKPFTVSELSACIRRFSGQAHLEQTAETHSCAASAPLQGRLSWQP